MNLSMFQQSRLDFNYLFTKLKNAVPGVNFKRTSRKAGQVYLIGAGPGDIELLTLKAHRLLKQADVVMYDWLVNREMLTMIPDKTRLVFVGKKSGLHYKSQEEISKSLVDFALTGKTVVRLKGGDPSIFGRVAEECDALTLANIPFALVPGITAATGCAAYSGIPLTHRDCAQSVRFVTAHCKDEKLEPDWDNLASSNDTLVFYMGLNRIESIARSLIQFGMAETMPIAIIDQGTSSQQEVCVATIASIGNDPKWQEFTGPALIVVGEVVNKRQRVDLEMLAHCEILTID